MSHNQTTYLVTLKPLQPYFFGGEQLHETGNKSDFFVRSTKFPQQTALLGVIRHFLLLHQGLIGANNQLSNRKEAADLIGKRSFSVGGVSAFGTIDTLGPVGIGYQNDIYYPAPLDHDFRWHKVNLRAISLQRGYSDKSDAREMLFSDDYEPKEANVARYVSGHQKLELPDDQSLFQPITRPGITKSRSGRVSDQAYFRQQYYQLHPSCSFCFYLTLKASNDFNIDLSDVSDLMLIGGEQSPFQISFARKTPPAIEALVNYPTGNVLPQGWNRLVLLSDTYLPKEEDLVRRSAFSVNLERSFRSISTVVQGENDEKHTSYFHNVRPREKKGSASAYSPAFMSNRYFLYERGSVFYFRDDLQLEKACDAIQAQKEFHSIGYNRAVSFLK